MAVSGLTQLVRVSQRMTYNNAIAVYNVFHLFTTGTVQTAAAIANDWSTNMVPAYKAPLSSYLSFNDLAVLELYPNYGNSSGASLSGTGALAQGSFGCAPAVCACVITWRTGIPGRSYRGRTYLTGLRYVASNVAYNGMQWSSTNLGEVGTLASAIRNRYNGTGNPLGLELGVYSRKLGDAGTPAFVQGINRVVAHTVQGYIATMGSRRAGRGL